MLFFSSLLRHALEVAFHQFTIFFRNGLCAPATHIRAQAVLDFFPIGGADAEFGKLWWQTGIRFGRVFARSFGGAGLRRGFTWLLGRLWLWSAWSR